MQFSRGGEGAGKGESLLYYGPVGIKYINGIATILLSRLDRRTFGHYPELENWIAHL